MSHGDLCGPSTDIARSIRHLERDRVDTSVSITPPFSAELDRLAVVRNNNVVQGVAIRTAVFSLIAGHLTDLHISDAYTRVTIIHDAGDQIG